MFNEDGHWVRMLMVVLRTVELTYLWYILYILLIFMSYTFSFMQLIIVDALHQLQMGPWPLFTVLDDLQHFISVGWDIPLREDTASHAFRRMGCGSSLQLASQCSKVSVCACWSSGLHVEAYAHPWHTPRVLWVSYYVKLFLKKLLNFLQN